MLTSEGSVEREDSPEMGVERYIQEYISFLIM